MPLTTPCTLNRSAICAGNRAALSGNATGCAAPSVRRTRRLGSDGGAFSATGAAGVPDSGNTGTSLVADVSAGGVTTASSAVGIAAAAVTVSGGGVAGGSLTISAGAIVACGGAGWGEAARRCWRTDVRGTDGWTCCAGKAAAACAVGVGLGGGGNCTHTACSGAGVSAAKSWIGKRQCAGPQMTHQCAAATSAVTLQISR